MRWTAALLACLDLTACGKESEPKGPSASHGRYLGVGTYPAGRLWEHLAGAPEPRDKAKARLAKAGCRAGKIRGRGRVVGQSRKAGTVLAAGARVGLRLKRKPR